MGDRELELKLREDNGDTSAALVPIERLSVESPFTGETIQRSKVDLFYFIPCEALFSKSAQGFGQIRGAVIPNSTRCYQAMTEHIFLQASTVGAGEVDEQPIQYPTWTVVPSATDPRGYAGYLYRVIYTVDPTDALAPIDMHLRTCTTKKQSAVYGGSRFDKRPLYQRFTYSEWVHMCDYYLKGIRTVSSRSKGFSSVDSPMNPYYPEAVFSLAHAINKMKSAGASAEFCEFHSYLDENGAVRFPDDGAKTFLLNPDQMDVTKIRKTYLPHIPRAIPTFENEEFRAFARDAGLKDPNASLDDQLESMELDSEAGRGNDQGEVNLDTVMKAFSQLTATGEPESANTLLGWKERCQKRMTQARKEAKGDPERYARLRREAQSDCIRWFMSDIFTTDETADVGDALRANAGWFNDFLRKNRNFMMPNEKFSKNLSRFGDTHAQEAALGDSVWAIHVAHQEVASLRLSSLHVYFYSPFHANVCLLGGPGSGKSNAFKINNMRLIPGTTRDIGVESGKAKMTPGKKTDLSIETYEDIAPSQVGVSNQVSGGANGTTSNTDAESMLKYRLTKGRMKGVYKAVINGVHTMVEVDSFCNTVMLIGMNAILSQIPESIANRFNNIQFQSRTRMDSNGDEQGTSSKFAHDHNTAIKPVQTSTLRRDQRNQVFHAIISLLVWAGVFVLNMAVCWLIWSKVLAKAKTKGLQKTGEVRHFERLQFHGETLVVGDAITRVLDAGPESPLDISKPFELDDILHFEKHLYGNTEHAAFALGLLQHQWENPIIHAVEKFFKDVLLKKLIKDGAIGRPPIASRASSGGSSAAAASAHSSSNLDKYYYITKIDGLPLHSGLPDAQRLSGNIQRLQRHASRLMMPCPQPSEITHALDCLSQLQVEVIDPATKKRLQIPALMFSPDGEVMISVQHMSCYTSNRMQVCLVEVLSHKYTKPKNLLYGKTREKNPNVYQTVRIQPDPEKQLVMEQSSYFSEAILKMTHNAVKGVSASAYERRSDELQEEEVEEDVFNGLFSDSPHKDVDMDLDDWASQAQCEKIGLRYFPPTRDAPNYDTTPDAIMRATIQRMGENGFDELATYPLCFKELQPVTYKQTIRADKASNPAKYSLKATVGKRKRAEGEEEEEKDQENRAPAAAPTACNVDYFCSDHEEEEEEEEEPAVDEDEEAEGYIPPPGVLAHGGPDGAPLPQAWNFANGQSRFNDDEWNDAVAVATSATKQGVYQPLGTGVAPVHPTKKARHFTEEDD